MTKYPTIRLHPDAVAHARTFKSLPEGSLLVRSRFLTIQGEGPFMGRRAFFIRLAGCNYGDKVNHCGGTHLSCDTDFRISEANTASIHTLRYDANVYNDEHPTVVVLTGGEPLLQWEELKKLVELLDMDGITVQIETNGVYLPALSDFDCDYGNLHIVASPKAHEANGYSDVLLRKLVDRANRSSNLYLKILIGTGPYAELPGALDHLSVSARCRTYLSPITTYASSYDGEVANSWDPNLVDQARTAANHALAAKLALANGFNLSIQMHNFCTIP